ncbi:MAG: AmmeMemoRadiSam system protein B [Phycisphaeraceae bacterium]|nr:AmmeMemoRadiSam system protein B [Phycisphaeraceae bacterium]MCB9846939.1 AmmeMemoRadiSam system protein B [Phycisphaeraceae bacterium]
MSEARYTDEAPKFDPNAAHMTQPKLRPVRGFPYRHEDQTFLGLADAQQISDKILYTAPAAQMILPHMTGEKDLDAIVTEVGQGLTREMLETLVAQLDFAGLLEGPVFDELLARVREDYESSDLLPPGASEMFTKMVVNQTLDRTLGEPVSDEELEQHAAESVAKQFDKWIDEILKDAEDPSFHELPHAIIAPHIDYPRGWQSYASVYGRLRVVDRPDRVIILGTNHFGRGTGVVGCDKGYETPLGPCQLDTEALETLKNELGDANADRLLEHRYDHEREHSVECQLMWLQHVFGPDEKGEHIKTLGILVHDPTVNNGESYDGNGLAFEPFVAALKRTIESLPGRTLVIASADLSHVGPQHGDPKPLAGEEQEIVQARNRVVAHDQEMLGHVAKGSADELISAMAWMQNPTRWCSVGCVSAMLKAVDADDIKMIQYTASMDPGGMSMVTSCAAALF